jgi:hypothetical protein
MQLADELLESEKFIDNNTKMLKHKVNDINTIGHGNIQILKRNNEEIKQCNTNIKKNNEILESEKVLFSNELHLCDTNNLDARQHIKDLEENLDKEMNAKDAEQLTNHGLKQNTIDLNGKVNLLDREYSNLTVQMDDLQRENLHLKDSLANIQKQLFESNRVGEDLRRNNQIADDTNNAKIHELENMKQLTSSITLNYERELTHMNKNLNDICSKHNNLMNDKEDKYKDQCYQHESHKNNIINDHNRIRNMKENVIEDLNADLERERLEHEDAILDLTTQVAALHNEL